MSEKIFARLPRKFFQSEENDYHCYSMRMSGGKMTTAVFHGRGGPKPLKTVEYIITGEWVDHEKYGKQFDIQGWERAPKQDANIFAQMRIAAKAKKALG